MCKCAAGTVACCCCSCAMSLFISILSILVVIAIVVILAVYFGLYNVDETAPSLAKAINSTRDHINDQLSQGAKEIGDKINN